MNHQNHPPLLHLQSTNQILHRATTVTFSTRSHFLFSLLLSLLLFSFKLQTQIITHYFKFKLPTTISYHHLLMGDFNPEINHRVFENTPTKPQINATSFTLDSYIHKLGFCSLTELSFTFANKKEKVKDLLKIGDESKNDQILAVLSIVIEVSAFYVLTSLGFVATHSCVHGVIFVLLVNHKLKKTRKPTFATFQQGTILCFKRLSGFSLTRCVVRLPLTMIFVLCFFREIKDRHTPFKIFIKLTCMQFFIWFPQVEVFEKGIYGFWKWWFLLEMLMSLVVTMGACVVMVDSNKEDWPIMCHLVSLNIHPTIRLKCLEDIVFGLFARYILGLIFGDFCSSFIQSFMEVYFMVVWTTYYFSVKSMDAHRKGERLGKREFKTMLRDDDT